MVVDLHAIKLYKDISSEHIRGICQRCATVHHGLIYALGSPTVTELMYVHPASPFASASLAIPACCDNHCEASTTAAEHQ